MKLNNKDYAVAKDIASALGYKNTNDAILRHCKGVVKHEGVKFNGGTPSLIPEGDIYRLITQSELPGAEKFETWVFDEVLPTIRKTGQYSILPKDYAQALRELAATVEKAVELEAETKLLHQVIEDYEPKVTYYDTILSSQEAVNINVIANDYGLTAQGLNNILHSEKIQYKEGKIWLLYKEFRGKGYTKSHTFVDSTGEARIHTKWTQKGRLLIYEILAEKGIKAIMDIE